MSDNEKRIQEKQDVDAALLELLAKDLVYAAEQVS